MDKRIIKTKRNIKKTFIELLQKNSFEKITVTDLCERGCISRITFYTYYDDKFALVDEMMNDYFLEALDEYHALQKENNPQNYPLQGYLNMLTAILDLYFNHINFYSHTEINTNPYLYSAFYHSIFQSIYTYLQRHNIGMQPRYSIRKTVILLCNGFLGLITDLPSDVDPIRAKAEIVAIYQDVLSSHLFESS